MADFYIYLVSSLPALHFGAKPPLSFEKLLEACVNFIPDEDLEVIKNLKDALISDFAYDGKNTTLTKWYIFETNLRNELVKIRASRKKIDASRYLRRPQYVDPSVTHTALAAQRSVSLLEREKILDLERWRVLDELAIGHYFDLEFLIVYAQKLLILERWETIRLQDKRRLLEEVVNT